MPVTVTFGPAGDDAEHVSPVAAEIRKFHQHTCTSCSPGRQCNPLMYCPHRNNPDGTPRAAATSAPAATSEPTPASRRVQDNGLIVVRQPSGTYAVYTPTRRQTTTAGLVVVQAPGGSYAVHQADTGLEVADHLRRLRDALAIGNQLGRYEVYYTLPSRLVAEQWDHAVVGGRTAIARWLDSFPRVGDRSPACPLDPPAAQPPRLIAARCHYCTSRPGRGSGGYGPYGDQCGRCWDAYPVLGQRGWCMGPTTFIQHLPLDEWRELTDAERDAWDRWTSSDAYRNA